MNIRPLDMQVLIPKTTEVSKIQQIENHKGNLQQQEFATEMQKSMMQKEKQVQTTSKSEGEKVDKDKEKQKQKRSKQQRDKEEAEKKEKQMAGGYIDPNRGSFLDIET